MCYYRSRGYLFLAEKLIDPMAMIGYEKNGMAVRSRMSTMPVVERPTQPGGSAGDDRSTSNTGPLSGSKRGVRSVCKSKEV